MRIYPRIVELDTTAADGEGNCFFIKNSSLDHRVLLFKIRRSDPKLVDFTPKRGIIEPGVTQCVHLSLSDAKVSYARLLVKLVVLNRDDLVPDNFDMSWEVGANSKMIKKVIDIHNKAFVLNDEHSSEPTASIEGSDDYRNSPLQEYNDDDDAERAATGLGREVKDSPLATAARSRTPNSVDTNTINGASPSETVDTSDGSPDDSDRKSHNSHFQGTPVAMSATPASIERTRDQTFESFNSSFQYNATHDGVTAQTEQSSLDMSRTASLQNNPNLSQIILQSLLKTLSASAKQPLLANASPISENDALLVGLGLGMGLQLNGNTSSVLAGMTGGNAAAISSSATLSGENREDIEVEAAIHSPSSEEKINEDTTEDLPVHITNYSKLVFDGSRGCIIHVNGNDVIDNDLAGEIVRVRSDRILNDLKATLHSVKITHTKVTSLAAALVSIVDSIGGDKIKSLVCQDTMRHLQLSHSSLECIDHSINKFTKLSSLDLSNNNISSLESGLVLPYLQHLKLSGNRLKTLDFLQHQAMLESLDVSGNRLSSFRYSVHLLVPLASSLKSLNLSRNPICAHKKYVSDVMSIVPKLESFDAADLTRAHKTYKKSNALAIKTNPSAPPLPIEISTNIFPPNAPLDDKVTSDSNAANDEKVFRWRVKNALRSKKFEEKRLSATVRESRNRERSFVHPYDDASISYSANYSTISSAARRVVSTPFTYPERMVEEVEEEKDVEEEEEEEIEDHVPFASLNVGGASRDHPCKEVDRPPAAAVQSPGMSHFEPSVAQKKQAPVRRASTLLMPTQLDKSRRRSFGISTSLDSSGYSFQNTHTTSSQQKRKDPAVVRRPTNNRRDCSSDSEVAESNPYRKRGDFDGSSRRSPTELSQMNTDERFSIWHPRYKVPKPTFGHSKPFAHRPEPSPAHAPKPPLFDKFVRRLRDGFEKLPSRGTFSRESKSLPADFYPMDWDDVEAFRRQGYFKETIGSIQERSFRDRNTAGALGDTLNNNGSTSASFQTNTSSKTPLNTSVIKRTKSEVYLQSSPSGSKDVRDYISSHISRMYSNGMETKFARPPDEFSDYRKWHPELFVKNGYLTQDVDKQSAKLKAMSSSRSNGNGTPFNTGSSSTSPQGNHKDNNSNKDPIVGATFRLFKHQVEDTEEAEEGGSEWMRWLEQQGER